MVTMFAAASLMKVNSYYLRLQTNGMEIDQGIAQQKDSLGPCSRCELL